MEAPRKIRLQFGMSPIFVLLILPDLSAVNAFSSNANALNLQDMSWRFVDRTRHEAIDIASNSLEPVTATTPIFASYVTREGQSGVRI